jgi:16S rRNA C967 or C1407 C5-methylase (RsmB/RsmF family)
MRRNNQGEKIMKKRTLTEKTLLKQWARNMGEMAAQTEMTALEAKAELEVRVRDFRASQEKALKRLSSLHSASHRALKIS